jgi:tol-pal system protein YbgF
MSSLVLVRRLVVAAALAAAVPAVGCGSSSLAAREGTTARVVASPTAPETVQVASAGDEAALRLRAAEEESDRRARRIRELESRLALRDAEVRDLQEEVDTQASDAARELAAARQVRARVEETEEAPAQAAPEASAEEEPRVVLRLYGTPELPPVPTTVELGGVPGAMRAPLYLPAPPPASMGRLPVLATSGGPVPPIPDQPIYVAPNPVQAPPPQADLSVREYQAALQLVTARRFEEADAALSQFLRAHPDHSYADNAMYWRAETLYARRDFAAAERELSEMVRRFPQGNKVPDALLRLGFCRQRQGDPEGARQYFRRVVAGYPGSVAARLASREDT